MIAQCVRARTKNLAVGPGEFHVAVEASALGRFADPVRPVIRSPSWRRVDNRSRAWSRPKKKASLCGIGHRIPMRHRDRLNPLNPHRIVDVAKLVDVLGPGDQFNLEGGPAHDTCVSMKA